MRALPASVLARPPRAPSQAEWDALTPAEQQRVVDALPSEPTAEERRAMPPEGDPHHEARELARGSLGEFFGRQRRGCYVGGDMFIYYPDTERFAPDVFVVMDVPLGPRNSWVVAREGKGPDFVLEILHLGDPQKDLKDNVILFGRLGIPEYFVFDSRRRRLQGWRLEEDRLVPLMPQYGRFTSHVLGLDLVLEDGGLRFYHANARLLAPPELAVVLQRTVAEVNERLELAEARAEEEQRLREEEQRLREESQSLREAEQRLREEEQRLREEEQRLRADAERRLALALAELERLKGR